MKTNPLFVFFIVLLLVISLTACNRSLAPKTASTATSSGQVLTPASTGVMESLFQFATQTAMAQGTGVLPGQTTPQPPVETVVVPPPPTSVPPTAIPPTAISIVVPTPTPGIPKNYTLEKGEFPFCIARRFNVNPSELLSINGLGSSSIVYAGLTLKIPQTGNPFPGSRTLRAHPTTYTVQAGDSLGSIACLFGDVDPNSIALANALTPPYKLTSGQSLSIP